MATYAPSALDLGLGPGDMLRRQQQMEDEERKKKLLRLSQPGGATYGAGMGGTALSDLFGVGRG